ncbi:MAG: carboxypeptidase-like regulatory domain-containing protein, partial [Runella zeae]
MKRIYTYLGFLLLLWCLTNGQVFAQQKGTATPVTIKGKVIALENNEAIPGVNVVIKGTAKGTTTDAKGEYSITVPDANTKLTFSFLGYLSQDVVVGKRTQLNISLVQDAKALEEVVVVGYGTSLKKDLSGSIASVSAE